MNRRNFLKLMGAGAGATALVGATDWGGALIGALAAPNADPPDPVWQALNRLTFGPTPGLVNQVKQMGLQAFIDQQLAPDKIDDSAMDAMLGNYPTLAMTVPELLTQQANKMGGQVAVALDSATVLRGVYSQRQLLEIMTNFWSEQFNIYHGKDIDDVLKTADDRDVVRKYAFGKFRDLLGASAHSPAMLFYLDNAESTKQHPNENYAREVMELHTLGVGNYTEQDIQEVARAFTGWTIIFDKNNPNWGNFTFNAKLHDTGAKTVLGNTIPAGGGVEDGEKVLDILAAHPATATHIATRLCHRFISDTPSDSAVKTVATAFTQSGGDITATLRALFGTPDFAAPPPKYKRPWEYTISMLRALNAQPAKTDPQAIGGVLGQLKEMGHLPFDHVMADGYSDVATSWEGNMLLRWNLAISTVYGKLPNFSVDLTKLVTSQGVPIDPNSVIQFFAQHLFGRALTQDESTALMGYMNQKGTPDLTQAAGRQAVGDTIALMLATPAFQYR